MRLSTQQANAALAVREWLGLPVEENQVFYLAGYAGTGKTTIVNQLVQDSDLAYDFMAYTGKAVSVLCKKGNPARTIHSAIYRPQKPDEGAIKDLLKQIQGSAGNALVKLKQDLALLYRPKFVLREREVLEEFDLIVVDEVSMVGADLGRDLLSFGKKVLVLGDPGQLPPIGGAGFFTNRPPDFLLTEIHRQAEDNPIIRMATLVRQGHTLGVGAYGESKVVRKGVTDPFKEATSQVICGRNTTRKIINNAFIDRLWPGSELACLVPPPSAELICLRNNAALGILNGTQWTVASSSDEGKYIDLVLYESGEDPTITKNIKAHAFETDLSSLSPWNRRLYEEFDFGYGITCHKSQGSQWPSVYIIDESWMFREDKAKWLYTALTRAEDRVVVVQT